MHRRARAFLAAFALVPWAAAAGGGPPGAAAHPAQAYALTIRGGVSLGAHEAGVAYYALSSIQTAPAVRLRIVTGASAGSLNGLLALLGECGGFQPQPEESLLWQTWIPIGFDQLFAPDEVDRLGAFSRRWLLESAARIERAWAGGLPPSCDVVLGVAVTRAEPQRVPIAGGRLELPSMEEKFTVRIRGRGAGRPPLATNYAGRGGLGRRLLVTDAQGEIAFPALRDLLLASMSFPVAFPPQPLATCAADGVAMPEVCSAAEAVTDRYVDGGVFDNGPVRLAVGIARAGLAPDVAGGLAWRPAPDPAERDVPRGVLFAFFDPEATEYPAIRPEPAPTEESLARVLGRLAAGVIDTARTKELALLVEEHPAIADQLVLPRRHLPAASAPVFAFLGFFETEFRRFDFTLGMYDARRALEDDNGYVASPTPEAAGGPGWRRFTCMSAVYEGRPDAPDVCAGADLADFRALLQVSLDQLHDLCRAHPLAEGGPSWRNPQCERGRRGEPPPHVPGLAPARWPDWRQGAKETELAWSMRLLGAYGFRFTDLGVPPGRGDLAVDRIRSALGRAGEALAAAQPAADRVPVAYAARLGADLLSYEPPAHLVHLSIGPVETEAGVSRAFHGSTWFPRSLRLAGTVGARGLEAVFSSGRPQPFGVLGAAGLEWQPPSSALARVRLGLRGGWLLAKDDGWGGGTCADRGHAGPAACSGPVVQGLVSTSVLDRLRLQVVAEWFPSTGTRTEHWSIAPGIGGELGF
ncbi:MAG: patatin-like phospholipase family protein [Anaeromyxobacter sp.]